MQDRSLRRAAAVAVLTLAVSSVAIWGAVPAMAGRGNGGGQQPPPTVPPAGSADGSINVHVETHTNHTGHDGNSTPLQSTDVAWAPPGCWFEPRFTPEQYQTYVRGEMAGWSTGKEYIQTWMNNLESAKYNQGKDGVWWQIRYNPDVSAQYALDHCTPYAQPEVWVPTGDPTPPPGVPTPKELKDIAYAATQLPDPPVQLSPVPTGQVVNLATYVKFQGALDRVWVTAQILDPAHGINVAATTVAVPVALRVDAGTADASPQSCTYDLTKGAGGYQVDSSADACNITYRKAGDYTVKAHITWRVTWTPSANPDGPAAVPPLPDGLSAKDIQVITKEIQTVVR